MSPRMLGPDGRELLEIPPIGVHAMEALGWTNLEPEDGQPDPAHVGDSGEDESTEEEPEQEEGQESEPSQKPATRSRARKTLPKPGDD